MQQKGHALQTLQSPNVNQAAPTVSATPHLVPHSAINQTLTVNTQDDSPLATPGSTSCVDVADGSCSLRAAVEAANNDTPNVDQINVPAGYDIKLDSGNGEIDITNSMFISGLSGGAAPVVDGQGNIEDFRILENSPVVPAVEMSGLTIQGGSAVDGGNIYVGDSSGSAADLTLSGVTVTGGAATDGGGIYVDQNSAFWSDPATAITGNSASDCGGGLYARDSGTVISGSTISNNSAGCGGGIYNGGAVALDAAQINGNSAEAGGGVFNDYSLSDTGSSYDGNTAGTSDNPISNPEGAAVWNDDAANLTNVTISNSQAWATNEVDGGAIFNAWQMGLTNVSVSNTTSRADGQSIYGGVIANEADQGCCGLLNGTLSVNGLTVSGTSNGADGVDTFISGGVLYNDYRASVTGLNVSSTTNNTGANDLYGGVGDVDWTIGCCPTNFDGGTTYQNVTVSGTSNAGSGDAYHEGGVFDVAFDSYSNTPLSGNVTDASIARTSDTMTAISSDNEIDGAVAANVSSIGLSNVSIDSTTVNSAGGSVYGAAVASLADNNPSEVSANNVSVTNTNVSSIGGGNGYVEGGAWFNGDELNATNVQILDTTVTSDDEVDGAALANDGDVSNIVASTIARTNTTMQAGGGSAVALYAPTALINVTVDDNTTTSPSDFAVTLDTEAPVGFSNVTVANDTVSGAGDNAGIYTDEIIHSKNSIVQTNGGPNCELDGGTVVSAGGNLEVGGNTCNFNLPSDQNNVANALVAPVANNSGPVETAALLPGSPAIGRGVSAGCPSTDARGVVRPSGSCDVGAFQLSTQGYWMVASDGGIFSFGNAGFYGSMGGRALNSPIVGMAITPDGKGYWEVAADGGVFTFGDASYHGSMGGLHLNKPIVGMASTPDGQGYWEVATDGGIFSFGDAQFYGSTGSIHLNKPIVGMAAAPNGNGYWLVASDGGIFNYGSGAGFFGSAGSLPLNKPVVGMSAAPNGNGYWLVASDGGIFTYGPGANFFGSTGSIHLNKPVVGMAATPSGQGYWLFASDGGVFNYGDATFEGSMGGTPLVSPVVGGAASPID